MSLPMIEIDNVSKEYRLGAIGGTTLNAEIQSKIARLRGKEDPNSKIGTKQHEKITDRREAIFRAVELAETDDIVIILGKGHEDYQILKDETIHFDDKEVAREAVAARKEEK